QTSGTVTKWNKEEGAEVSEYDLVFEISTESLYSPREGPDKVGPTNMLIELVEEGVLRKILVKEGQTVGVGQAIGIICEEESGIESAGKIERCMNLYEEGSELRVAHWQGYLG
ncbi:unnamed protein product, partial [Discosporangium mesarthrocarpum]